MFNSNEGYSLADIATATGRNDSYGGDFMGNGAWWIIILFLFAFCGWGGNGFGSNRNSYQEALTRADLCQDMNFSQLENGVKGLQQGLCDGFYTQNTNLLNGFANIQNNLTNGFAGVESSINTLGYQTQQGLSNMNVANMQNTNAIQTQLAQCCCDNRSGQKDIEYRIATDTCAIQNTVQNTTRDIINNANDNTRSILDFLVQDKISTLQAENQSLKFAASQVAQNTYLIDQLRPCPIPAYITTSPYQSYNLGYACTNSIA